MFERYTEPARRVLFFARDEASKSGGTTIETEHLLLGLVREDKFLLRRFLPRPTLLGGIREQISFSAESQEKTSTSIDLLLSDECKRILSHTADEAARLNHHRIGTEHLLLGILREETCTGARVLVGLGLELKAVREEVLRRPPLSAANLAEALASSSARQFATVDETMIPAAGVVPDIETAKRIAEAVWIPRLSIVAGELVEAELANLTSGVWIVTGSLTRDGAETKLAAFIQKDDGKILRLHQEKAPA